MDDNIFRYPPPYSGMHFPRQEKPYYMTSEGMMMSRHMQPPPMYGPRGATIPPKYLWNCARYQPQYHTREFYCETCDFEFQFQVDLEDHINEHRKCGIDGCAFFAHETIINQHIEQQHKTGIYDKLKGVNTLEQISKWREERRKRYPSQANVALRQQVQAERLKRGERLNDKNSRFGNRSDKRKCRPQEPVAEADNKEQKKKRKRTHKPKKSEVNVSNPKETNCKPVEDFEEPYKAKAFRGTRDLYEQPEPANKVVKKANALSSLLALYGSDSDESDNESSKDELESVQDANKDMETSKEDSQCQISSDEEDYIDNPSALVDIMSIFAECSEKKSSHVDSVNEQPVETETIKEIPKAEAAVAPINEPILESENTDEIKTSPARHNSESDASDQQEEVPFTKVVEDLTEIENESKNENVTDSASEKKQLKRPCKRPNQSKNEKPAAKNVISKQQKDVMNIQKINGLNYSLLRRRKQNTMLEKLLRSDIVHERNVLLQCVRYVVENNFFGIGQPTKSSET